MTVGILGLGLIGGSLARAYHDAGHRVLGCDRDASTVQFAQMAHAVDAPLTEENIGSCELLLLAVCPQAAADYLEAMGDKIAKTAVVVDCCGIKRQICEAGFRLAERCGWLYVGGHPMAGTHNSGFKYATPTMFHNAPMVLVPADHNDIDLLSRVKELLAYGDLTVSEIADKLRYSSVAHLSAQFRAQTGMSPTEFRRLKGRGLKPLDEV